jgi:hypothetical protein
VRDYRSATTLEEWRELVADFNRDIRTWGVPISVMSSGAPEVLPDGDTRVAGSAVLMAHGYGKYDEGLIKNREHSSLTHSLIIRSTCPIPDEDKWICHEISEALLDDGYPVSVQRGQKISHLFHIGKNDKSGMRYISFGIRASDEDAVLMRLRDFKGVQLMKIEGGEYLGFDGHP